MNKLRVPNKCFEQIQRIQPDHERTDIFCSIKHLEARTRFVSVVETRIPITRYSNDNSKIKLKPFVLNSMIRIFQKACDKCEQADIFASAIIASIVKGRYSLIPCSCLVEFNPCES